MEGARRKKPPSPLALTTNCIIGMLVLGAPLILIHAAEYVAQITEAGSANAQRDIFLYDVFSGQKSVSNAFRDRNFKSLTYDIVDRPADNNILSVPGFLRLVQGGLRIVEDGALHAGPPCSTWVWLNRGTSGRSMDCVMGDSNQPSVLEGNTIMARFALIAILCLCRCVHVTIEQPRSSIMKYVKYFQYIAKMLGTSSASWRCTNYWMGSWGHSRPKPSTAFGNAPYTKGLYKRLSRKKQKAMKKRAEGDMVIHYSGADGKKKVRGGPKLKESQTYPKKYGRRYRKLHCRWVATHVGELRESLYGDTTADAEGVRLAMKAAKSQSWWVHADLEELRSFLKHEAQEGRYKPVFTEGLY